MILCDLPAYNTPQVFCNRNVGLHGVTHGGNGRLFPISCGRMCYICAEEDHWLLEHQRPGGLTGVQFSMNRRISRSRWEQHPAVHNTSVSTDLPCGSRMLLTPPSLTLIFRQRLERVWGVVFWTFFTCTHCVAMPSIVSPTRFTSAVTSRTSGEYRIKHDQVIYVRSSESGELCQTRVLRRTNPSQFTLVIRS